MIFTENTTQLNQTAHIIHMTMNYLETYSKLSGASAQSVGSAQLPAQSDGVAQLTGTPPPWSWSWQENTPLIRSFGMTPTTDYTSTSNLWRQQSTIL